MQKALGWYQPRMQNFPKTFYQQPRCAVNSTIRRRDYNNSSGILTSIVLDAERGVFVEAGEDEVRVPFRGSPVKQ